MSKRDMRLIIRDKLASMKRRRAGGWSEQTLIEELAKEIKIDVAEEKLRRAKEAVDKFTKPNSTETDGQLELPGISTPIDYEPERLIRDDFDSIDTQDLAAPPFMQADARRASKHAREASYHAEIKITQSSLYSDWAIEQYRMGRKEKEVTFGNFVREANIWKKEPPKK